jgi:hypothetical protein
MDLIIELTGIACEITGVKEIPLTVDDAATFRDTICRLGEMFPVLKGVIITLDGDALLNSVLLSRNGVEMIMPDQMGELPENGDRLAFIPIIVGGDLSNICSKSPLT